MLPLPTTPPAKSTTSNPQSTTLKVTRAALVYQAGIANVFAVEQFMPSSWAFDDERRTYYRGARNLAQNDFRACEFFACGLKAAGVEVRTFSCNRAGDIASADWTPGLDDCPFRDNARPVQSY